MKKIVFIAIVALTVSFVTNSCSKDTNSNDPDDPTNVETYLTKEIIKKSSGTLYTMNSMYFYDNSKRLKKIVVEEITYSNSKSSYEVDFIYNTDGTLDKTISSDGYVSIFRYINNKLSKVIETGTDWNDTYNDTLYLYYDNSGQILKTTEFSYWSFSSGSVNKREEADEYELNSNGRITQIKKTFKKYGNGELDIHNMEIIIYEYSSNGNLISSNSVKTDILTNEESWIKYQYEYDAKLNYWPTKHFPKEYLFIEMLYPDDVYSSNNTTLSTYTSSSGDYEANIRNITNYNSNGYPITITANWGSIELEYSQNISPK
ncbi:MAG: hypothetical protein WC780_05050 [Lentimicrobiaceae bacterium]|jgi:hypothetical protein